ncbi:MAG: HAD family hydrolase [Lachnospiraceae bacterium]|nr:HAD family hydrolase [Lachnospiraceae bacterium]
MCQYYGSDIQDTVAFGDSMNDYEMMETAGISVAMGNACDTLKNMADRICEAVWDDGIYHEFQRMGII